jgi:hypothetical protein
LGLESNEGLSKSASELGFGSNFRGFQQGEKADDVLVTSREVSAEPGRVGKQLQNCREEARVREVK